MIIFGITAVKIVTIGDVVIVINVNDFLIGITTTIRKIFFTVVIDSREGSTMFMTHSDDIRKTTRVPLGVGEMRLLVHQPNIGHRSNNPLVIHTRMVITDITPICFACDNSL